MAGMQRRSLVLAAGAALAGAAGPLRAQAYPARQPIRYIVPVAAGGGSDMVGRTVTERWGRVLGQSFVVENQGGGGGLIAAQNLLKSRPDGYTLMQGYVSTHGTSPATRKLGYDPVRDFTPVGMIGGTPNVLVVSSALAGVTDFKSFMDYARRNAGAVAYGSAGPGSLTHLVMELFKQQASVNLTHVPYRGIAPAFTDLIGGQTQVMFPGLAAAVPHIRSGRVRALAVTGARRAPQLPETPTLDELGYPGFDAQQWYGVVGPAGLPSEVTKVLNDSLAQVLAAPDLREKLSVEAIEPTIMTSAQFGAFIRADLARWTQLARERKIELD